MIKKQIIATTDIDRHGQKISIEMLRELKDVINMAPSAMRMGLEHDVTILPVGKILKGDIIALGGGSQALEVEIDDFINEFKVCEGLDGGLLYYAASLFDKRPFMENQAESEDVMTVIINPLNFSEENYTVVEKFLTEECEVKVETGIKKSYIPDPEIIFQLVVGTMVVLTTKKTLIKASDKLGDKISDDIANCYDKIKKMIKYLTCKITGRPNITYILSEPNQLVELVVQTSNAEIALAAIDALSAGTVMETTDRYCCLFKGNLKKMQFLFNSDKNIWELNYILTVNGQVIGAEKCYKKAVYLYNTIMQTPGAGVSIGGTAEFKDIEKEVSNDNL